MRVLVIGKFMFQAYTFVNFMKRVSMSKDVTIFTSVNNISVVRIFSNSDLRHHPFTIGKKLKPN